VKKLKSSRLRLPSPQRGEGLGGGDAVLSQRAFVFPHWSAFFSLSWNSMRHASPPPSPLAPLPRWGEGNRDRLIFSHLLTHYVNPKKETNSFSALCYILTPHPRFKLSRPITRQMLLDRRQCLRQVGATGAGLHLSKALPPPPPASSVETTRSPAGVVEAQSGKGTNRPDTFTRPQGR